LRLSNLLLLSRKRQMQSPSGSATPRIPIRSSFFLTINQAGLTMRWSAFSRDFYFRMLSSEPERRYDMRNWLMSVSVVLFVNAPVPAQDDAAAVVKKAIDAHGGAAALNKYKAGYSKFKGEISIGGMDLDYTGEITYQLPDKYNMTIKAEAGGQKVVVEQNINGMVVPMSDEEKAEVYQSAMLQEVEQLTPLLEGKKYTLKAEKDAEVDGKPAAVVVVTAKGLSDTKLFFDKKTMLLVKTERKTTTGPKGDKVEVVEETIMSDFKKVEGVQTAMKLIVNHDGKKFMTLTNTEVKLMEKADPKKFAIVD
jgi:hypothetical protein